jgi:predicted RNase H-like HicB family nuclease
MRYVVVYEQAPNNWSAYVPDLPGCVSTGATLEETRHNILEAMAGHLGLMTLDGDPIPEASAQWAEVVEVEPALEGFTFEPPVLAEG